MATGERKTKGRRGSASEPVPDLPELPEGAPFVAWRPGSPARAVSSAPAPARTEPADPLDAFFYRPDEDATALAALGAPEATGGASAPVVIEEYLTFTLGDERYGMPIGAVREVLKAPAITEVPRAPAGVLGIVTVRGEVVAVFDPRPRLGLPGAPPAGGRIVVVDAGEGPRGILVDAVSSVVRLPAGEVEPWPQGLGAGHGECLAGVGRERDRLFTVLHVAPLVRAAARPDGRARGA